MTPARPAAVRRLAAALAMLAVLAPATLRAAATDVEPGILRVTVTFQESNQFLPWMREPPRERKGYGIVVEPTLVLATEALVRNQRLVELQMPRSGAKIPATLVMADPQAGLALLRVAPDALPERVAPTPLAEGTGLPGPFEMLQFFDSGEIQRTQAEFVRVAMARLPEASYSSLVFSLRTDSPVNGQGAPVFANGRLAGIVMAYDRGTRIAAVAPGGVIRHFLDDARTPPYRGFASAGFLRAELVDPAKRAFFGVRREGLGVQVLQCLPDSPAARALRPADVVVEWDGHAVDNLGFYADPDYGRLDFTWLIKGRREPGDVVPVTLVREGRELKVDLALDCRDERSSLIPEDTVGAPPEYLVEGGFVLRELTARYLAAHGSDWVRNIDPRLAHLYLSRQFAPRKPGERVVVVAAVLADPINVGYQNLRNQVVEAVNGQPVLNLADLFRVAERDGSLRRLTLQSFGVDVVLDPRELPAANARLARIYRIPQLRYRAAAP